MSLGSESVSDYDESDDSSVYSDDQRTRPAQGIASFMFDVPPGDNEIEMCCFLKPFIAIFTEAKHYRDMAFVDLPLLARVVCQPAANNQLGTWQLSSQCESMPSVRRLNVV